MPLSLRSSLHLALLFVCSILVGSACTRGDVGAPCDHGSVNPPQSLTVSFPATSCNELICIYGDNRKPSVQSCDDDSDCNAGLKGEPPFRCEKGRCQVKPTVYLQNSMCSRSCETDDDCKRKGIWNYQHKDNGCKKGFACRRLQSRGSLCCVKLCVCTDQVEPTESAELKADCTVGANKDCKNFDASYILQ